MTSGVERHRPRQGPAHIVGGVPYADPESTLSLLPGAAVGQWLATQVDLVRGQLLDNGCGNQPYRAWYEPLVDHVMALDAIAQEGVDVIGFADRLPFGAEKFDTVLSTEVLEHVENAERAVAEIYRVLRPGGHALITVPYLYPTHEAPYDFRRFTHFGLTDLLQRNGFEVISLKAKGGPGMMLAHYGVLAAVQVLGDREAPRVRRILAAPQQAVTRRFELCQEVTGRSGIISLGYMAAARRPPA